MPYAVTIDNLRKNYAGEHALAGVSFSIAAGSLAGIIGADGAGKTTLMRILATLISADAGAASVLSYDVNTQHRKIRAAIGYMPQKFSLYEDLTVWENLLFFADVFGVIGMERQRRLDRLMAFSRLGQAQDRRAGRLSGGMKQKLALSCALIHTPRLLILDEPTTGVDPVSRNEFWRILKDLQRDGITIIVSTPYMDEAEYCDTVLLLHRGGVLMQSTPAQAVERYPHALFRAESRAGTVRWPARAPAPRGARFVYPSGGALHVAADPQIVNEPALLEALREVMPEIETLHRIGPRMNDVLFSCYNAAGSAGPESAPPPAPAPGHAHNPLAMIRHAISQHRKGRP
jgi:ABC-2 type transport system ATP-binding protein